MEECMATVVISWNSSTSRYEVPQLRLVDPDVTATWTLGKDKNNQDIVGEFEIWFPDHISPFRPGDDISKSGTLARKIKANTKRDKNYTYRYCVYLINQDTFVEGTTSPPEMVIE